MANPRLQEMFRTYDRQDIESDNFQHLLRFAHDEGRLGELLRKIDAAPYVWQPIETAPRDGTVILVYIDSIGDHPPLMEVVSSMHGGFWCNAYDHCYRDAVTHWMPLPPAPDTSD